VTHYEVLQVSRTASADVIEAAWKTLMRQHHPDKKGGSAERAREINQAHDVLSDSKKRAEYDLSLRPTPIHPRRGNPSAYPKAYPSPYPEPELSEAMQHVGDQLRADLKEAVERANYAMLEQLAGSNPLLRAVLETYRKGENRRRKR